MIRLGARCCLFVFLVIGFLSGSTTWAGDREIRVATDAGWPPMEMKGKDGKVCGFGVDVMDFIAKDQGFTVQYIVVPWDDIFASLENGKVDAIMSSVSITEERKAKYDFSESYFTAGQMLVVPKELAKKDLNGKVVGALKDSTGLDVIQKQKGLVIKSYDDIDKAFVDMKAGKVQGVVCDSPVAASYCLMKDEYKGKFVMTGEQFTREDYGIVVKKGNKELLDKINHGIADMKAKGVQQKLTAKWLK